MPIYYLNSLHCNSSQAATQLQEQPALQQQQQQRIIMDNFLRNLDSWYVTLRYSFCVHIALN